MRVNQAKKKGGETEEMVCVSACVLASGGLSRQSFDFNQMLLEQRPK